MNAVLIDNLLEKLTDSEKRIYGYLIENKSIIDTLKIKDISERTYTSAASVIRTAKKLGFKGYKELVYSILNKREAIKCDLEGRFDIKNPEKIERILEFLDKGKICIYGEGLESSIVQYMYKKLLLLGKNVEKINLEVYKFLDEQFANKKYYDVIIFITREGKNKRDIEMANYFKKIGTQIVIITSNKNSDIYQMSNLGVRYIEDIEEYEESYDPNLFYGYTIIFFEKLLKMYYEKKYKIMKKISK